MSGITVLIVLAAVGGLYVAFRHVSPLLASSGCEARPAGQVITMDPGQAGIAATIAGVAHKDALPARAVTVAYAAALQESKLRDLDYGDLDSVGVFQQRPSEGWGSRRQLIDPVYATTKFFEALTKIHGYLRLPVYKAAQAVQHSADGYAYNQYQPMAASLATAFTGTDPHAVWCWYGTSRARRSSLQSAEQELARTFGPIPVRASADPQLLVRIAPALGGWSVAAWLVSHAQQYGITDVQYAGYRWVAAAGSRGWTPDRRRAPPGELEVG